MYQVVPLLLLLALFFDVSRGQTSFCSATVCLIQPANETLCDRTNPDSNCGTCLRLENARLICEQAQDDQCAVVGAVLCDGNTEVGAEGVAARVDPSQEDDSEEENEGGDSTIVLVVIAAAFSVAGVLGFASGHFRKRGGGKSTQASRKDRESEVTTESPDSPGFTSYQLGPRDTQTTVASSVMTSSSRDQMSENGHENFDLIMQPNHYQEREVSFLSRANPTRRRSLSVTRVGGVSSSSSRAVMPRVRGV